MYWIIIAWCIVFAILSFRAGAPPLRLLPGVWAIIASFVSLPDLLFGPVLGVYTLLVFHSRAATGT
jgi:hypothetical protein